jgi:hypothetical protein
MRDLKTVNLLIDRIRNDYQFDSSSGDYMGFLNVDPSQDWTIEEWDAMLWMVENEPDTLEDILTMRGLSIESFGEGEVIFVLTEEPFGDKATEVEDLSLTQGRTEQQMEYSEMVVNVVITLALIAVLAVLGYSIFNL